MKISKSSKKSLAFSTSWGYKIETRWKCKSYAKLKIWKFMQYWGYFGL
jgi:hypothetical protein